MFDNPVDLAELHEIMDNDEELIKECFQDFLEDCGNMLSLIKEAIDKKDYEEIEKSAHALKGSLIYLAAGKAAETAYQIELSGRGGEAARALQLFDSLSDDCDKIKVYMRNY